MTISIMHVSTVSPTRKGEQDILFSVGSHADIQVSR